MFITFDLQISLLGFYPKEIIFEKQMHDFLLCQKFNTELFRIMKTWNYSKGLKITKRLVVVYPYGLMLDGHQKYTYKNI